MKAKYDAIIIGGGHNGLVCAALTARAGLRVLVLEAGPACGGACRTEYPFRSAPQLGASTGAYLLGPMPPELIALLGLELPLIRRDPYYFLPTRGTKYLLLGHDAAANREQFISCFSEQDWRANAEMQSDLERIREAVAPTWLEEPLSLEETAERSFKSSADRDLFLSLCRNSVMSFLDRYDFKSTLLKAMYAVTDGLIGQYASWDTPGTGFNFLVHNMCRINGMNGTWALVKGGMGAVSAELERVARSAAVEIKTNAAAAKVLVESGAAAGVALANGEEYRAETIVMGTDPFTMRELVGSIRLPDSFNARLDAYAERPGATMKVNLCLDALPTFRCLPNDRGQFRTTTHLLPEEGEALSRISEAFEFVQRGELPPYPIIELYTHTVADPSLRDPEGRHNAALFVQLVPFRLKSGSWSDVLDDYVSSLLAIVDEFAPGTSALVREHFSMSPEGIEKHFRIRGGHILHVDHFWSVNERLPYRGPIDGLYFCGAACHPGGAVTGAPGYNAAQAVLRDRKGG